MSKKKVDVQDITVEEKLEALYELQTVVSEIDRIRTIRGELPIEVEELQNEIEGRKTRKARYEAEIKELKRRISDRKNKIKEASALVDKYNEQLETVRNNREYDALSKEVEYQNLEVQYSEKRISEDEFTIKQLNDELAQLHDETEEREADLAHKQKDLDDIIAETRADEDNLRKQAKDIEQRIEPRLLSAFKRTRKASRNGLAVTSIDRDACMGCFNRIPPQRQLDVKLHKKIIVCEYCGRILVDQELANDVEARILAKKK